MSRVNIIVPVYNAAKYLPELLDSVFAQTVSDFLVIIINDCSTDGSEKVISEYIEKHGDKIVYIKNEHNMKQGPTRNVGLEASELRPSEYTAFLDADDWVQPDFLECMLSKAEQAEMRAETLDRNVRIFKKKLKLIVEQQLSVVDEIEELKIEN